MRIKCNILIIFSLASFGNCFPQRDPSNGPAEQKSRVFRVAYKTENGIRAAHDHQYKKNADNETVIASVNGTTYYGDSNDFVFKVDYQADENGYHPKVSFVRPKEANVQITTPADDDLFVYDTEEQKNAAPSGPPGTFFRNDFDNNVITIDNRIGSDAIATLAGK